MTTKELKTYEKIKNLEKIISTLTKENRLQKLKLYRIDKEFTQLKKDFFKQSNNNSKND
jgi:hypothetical protein